MGGTGPALLQKTRETGEISAERSIFVATAAESASDPLLARLIAAWPNLSAGVRELIGNLLSAAESAGPEVMDQAEPNLC